MIEIPVTELRIGDVGERVIVTFNGAPAGGVLQQILCFQMKHYLSRPPHTTLIVRMDAALTELKLTDLPPDYLIQIDRDTE